MDLMDQYLKANRKKNARKYIKKKKMEISQIPKNEKSKDQGDTMAKRLRNRRVIDIKKSLN